ncbi:MAG: radical SAM protein, partial [Planctomycetaceae bacterium]
MISHREPCRVLLVGFEDQDNLGLRYLSSRLKQGGHQTRFVTISSGEDALLDNAADFLPHIVGFSLIFQYLVPQYAELIAELRRAGADCHITIGGHYASFEPEIVLTEMPGLDSVVRFEGEDTLFELAERIRNGDDWRDLDGIAWRSGKRTVLNPLRPGRQDLDELPWPDRDNIPYKSQSLPTASVLGGRGCPWNCSFCSIVTFYEANGTKGRRRRDPFKIADELEHLYRDCGVRVILWQDDDFLAGGRAAESWAHAISDEVIARGLHRDMRWKISCRSDEVTHDTLQPLIEAGLTHVYMGVESGDPNNLLNLNKHLGPEVHLKAGDVLRDLGLSFDFGFMLLEPWSTIATVRNNIAFLREFAGDGASVVNFCRTLPYAGTPIAKRLLEEGRLTLRDFDADYSFLDPRLDVFYDWALPAFAQRNNGLNGTASLLRRVLFEASLSLPNRPADPEFAPSAKLLASLSNQVLLDTTEAALDHIEATADL